METGIDARELGKGPNEKRGADEERCGERDLHDEKRASSAAASAGAPAAFFEWIRGPRSRAEKGGNSPESDSGEERYAECVG